MPGWQRSWHRQRPADEPRENAMPSSASRFSGTYTILPPTKAAPPIPAEQKGARYISEKLRSYANAELELTVTDGSAGTPRVEGRLRVSPSQSFEVHGSIATTTGARARGVGRLEGNKGRTAAFTAEFGDDRLTFSLAYDTDGGTLVNVQSYLCERRAPAVALPPPDLDAALVEQWTAKLRRSRFTASENASDRDYSGGSYYQELHRDLQLYPDGTFRLDERGVSRVSAGGLSSTTPISRSRTGRWTVTASGATARLTLTSEGGNESFTLGGSGSAMSLDGRWHSASPV